ncbi:MAG: DNA-binding protein [Anaerolineaceae bacterium]|nr:DNA-binding protein [Anaerolineaceae bacterium]
MIRAFIDASVLFAATYSPTGTARDLINLGLRQQIALVISPHVTEEVRRNLSNKYPERLPTFELILANANFEEIDKPTHEEVLQAADYTALKDAPIVAAAVKAKCSHLVTYDRKHLLDRPEVAEGSCLEIVTPADVLDQQQ